MIYYIYIYLYARRIFFKNIQARDLEISIFIGINLYIHLMN